MNEAAVGTDAGKSTDVPATIGASSNDNDDEPPVVSSIYPAPPPFYKSYGPNGVGLHPVAVSLDPPTPPVFGVDTYQCFGENFDGRIRSLEESGRNQLFEVDSQGKPVNYGKELKKLANGSVHAFQGLLDALASEETVQDCVEKASSLEDHYVNILYLLNEYRPQQAREQMLEMLRDQLGRTKEMTQTILTRVASIEAELNNVQ